MAAPDYFEDERNPALNVVILGHHGHGKSTLLGQLSILSKTATEYDIREASSDAKRLGREGKKYAYLVDTLPDARERGYTINPNYKAISFPTLQTTFIDTPGHSNFIKGTIDAASQADVPILVVSAAYGEFEAGIAHEGQSYEFLRLIRALDFDHILVIVSKMDDSMIAYEQERFVEIQKDLLGAAEELGIRAESLQIIPVSGWLGENIIQRTSFMDWYKGPSLFQAISSINKNDLRDISSDFVLSIQDVYAIKNIGVISVGKVIQGHPTAETRVRVLPSGVTGIIDRLELQSYPITGANPGEIIGLDVPGVEDYEIEKGSLVISDTAPVLNLEKGHSYSAQISLLWHPTHIKSGYQSIFHFQMFNLPCKILSIGAKSLDSQSKSSPQNSEKNPAYLYPGESAQIQFEPLKNFALPTFMTNKLHRFIIRDMNHVLGFGKVIENEN